MSEFLQCEQCGKRLIRREGNRLVLKFGGNPERPVVSMKVRGAVEIECFKSSCRHINKFKTGGKL